MAQQWVWVWGLQGFWLKVEVWGWGWGIVGQVVKYFVMVGGGVKLVQKKFVGMDRTVELWESQFLVGSEWELGVVAKSGKFGWENLWLL
jgi:hypothetical protein